MRIGERFSYISKYDRRIYNLKVVKSEMRDKREYVLVDLMSGPAIDAYNIGHRHGCYLDELEIVDKNLD